MDDAGAGTSVFDSVFVLEETEEGERIQEPVQIFRNDRYLKEVSKQLEHRISHSTVQKALNQCRPYSLRILLDEWNSKRGPSCPGDRGDNLPSLIKVIKYLKLRELLEYPLLLQERDSVITDSFGDTVSSDSHRNLRPDTIKELNSSSNSVLKQPSNRIVKRHSASLGFKQLLVNVEILFIKLTELCPEVLHESDSFNAFL